MWLERSYGDCLSSNSLTKADYGPACERSPGKEVSIVPNRRQDFRLYRTALPRKLLVSAGAWTVSRSKRRYNNKSFIALRSPSSLRTETQGNFRALVGTMDESSKLNNQTFKIGRAHV